MRYELYYWPTIQGRGEFVRLALEEAGADYVDVARKPGKSGMAAMKRLLEVTPVPDGVFCYNDPVAIGAMRAISESGLRVPEDIAVVGAGNVHYSDFLAVPLTTVDQGTSEIGKRAAKLLLERIASKRFLRPRKVLIVPRLVVRQSTRRGSGREDAAEATPSERM